MFVNVVINNSKVNLISVDDCYTRYNLQSDTSLVSFGFFRGYLYIIQVLIKQRKFSGLKFYLFNCVSDNGTVGN